jgi:WD40 repeat protein
MQADPRDIITVQPDELIALGMKHGTVRLWHLPTDTVLFDAQHHGVEIRSLAFSPDGRTLAVAGSDEAVYLWHVATGRNVLTFDQLGSSVHRVIFSPDGTQLIAALHDGTIRIWHAPPAL